MFSVNFIRHEVIQGARYNTTRESLQRAGAICCVPIGLVSTLMDFEFEA